ncbi:hypothetical protein H5V45_07915 [Nocardioides sp. KIGAM211]|uniref:Thioesterase family protein n=1 Tax=Nocardioides luti TaxID=2761101 RepID=A0A7X0RH52_9ACTN|nr:hypothetical protein [Nocardioides luti]MBB6627245.1 hypothetical protein [Nocardioides luti]
MSEHPDLIVPRRFCGPPSSGNGGWTSGALAALVEQGCPDNRAEAWPPIRVALRKPPPLDTPMDVVDDGTGVTASVEGAVVARAEVTDADPAIVEPVPAAEARAAMATYPGLTSHPFPTCFACGTTREEGDGLRIFPGRVGDQDGAVRIAATWTPHASVAEDFHAYVDDVQRASLAATWAALDCIGGWAGDLEERLMVLGGMTARVDALPVVGEEHVVVGLARGQEGRKTFTAATLYDADGRVVACAEHVWVAVDPAAFA